MRFGKHKGCEFLEEKCIDSNTHKTNEKFENEFFDSIISDRNIDASCSSGRQSRTYKIFDQIPDIPEEYIYFANREITGYPPADYCPIFQNIVHEEENSYFSSHCSEIGGDSYGFALDYQINNFDSTSGALIGKTGESLSDHSFCFLSSLTKNSFSDSHFISNFIRANCYEIFCSERSLTLKIFDDYIVCPRQGGNIYVEGYNGYLLCPDYNLICSGTVICNDIFDCIDKKSEIKDKDYIYDYEIKTTQNIQKSAFNNNDNYELSENGKCPKYCKHCKENNKCLKCRDEYGLKSDDIGEIKCYPIINLIRGYYKNELTNLYEKCLDNCIKCTNNETCEECDPGSDTNLGYMYINNKCIKADNKEHFLKIVMNMMNKKNVLNVIKDMALKKIAEINILI